MGRANQNARKLIDLVRTWRAMRAWLAARTGSASPAERAAAKNTPLELRYFVPASLDPGGARSILGYPAVGGGEYERAVERWCWDLSEFIALVI